MITQIISLMVLQLSNYPKQQTVQYEGESSIPDFMSEIEKMMGMEVGSTEVMSTKTSV